MIKYRLHNITYFGVEINDFYTENSLNNYISLFVEPPYWVENLEAHENVYIGFDRHSEIPLFNGNAVVVTPDKLDDLKVSRETTHESEIEWIKRHTSVEEEKEPHTKLEKIYYILIMISVIIMASYLLYLFLSSVSFIAEYFSQFTWKVFNLL